MKHIKTVAGSCKTSCTVANQSCQNKGEKVYNPARKNA